jgi:hypothetical protein
MDAAGRWESRTFIAGDFRTDSISDFPAGVEIGHYDDGSLVSIARALSLFDLKLSGQNEIPTSYRRGKGTPRTERKPTI